MNFDSFLSVVYHLQMNTVFSASEWLPIRHGWKPITEKYFQWAVLMHYLSKNPLDSLIDDDECSVNPTDVLRCLALRDQQALSFGCVSLICIMTNLQINVQLCV